MADDKATDNYCCKNMKRLNINHQVQLTQGRFFGGGEKGLNGQVTICEELYWPHFKFGNITES